MATMVGVVGMGRNTVAEATSRRESAAVARTSVAKNVLLFFAAPFIGLAYIVAFPFVGVAAMVRLALR